MIILGLVIGFILGLATGLVTALVDIGGQIERRLNAQRLREGRD
jgi:hypothetical protein